jgi:hypothetical protein
MQRIDLALKRHQAAEQPRDAVVQRQQPGSASEELGADPVDDGLGRLIPARARLWLEENGL